MRRSLISFPDAQGLRPTPDRVRETLFNWLGQTLYGKSCLDLFAGSGALGFEAHSRGAAKTVMVEKNSLVFRALQENSKRLKCQNLTILNSDSLNFIAQSQQKYDVIFVDPPFDSDYLSMLWGHLEKRLNHNGHVYIETGEVLLAPENWQILKQGKAGKVYYHLLAIDLNASSLG